MKNLLLTLMILLTSAPLVHAGGPTYVAGTGFDPSVKGQPILWPSGTINYYTDQGDLSPNFNGASADTIVGYAFSQWTSIAGVSIHANFAGHLAEDVSGANVVRNSDGTYSVPPDIQASATGTPVGIVYDYDGKVTDALLGDGAGGIDLCFTNAVLGGPDNLTYDGNMAHALVVINGVCAADNAKMNDVLYRMLRVFGRVIGLGWSQTNPNVMTRNPTPGLDDFEGLPLMHYMDPPQCDPIAMCYPDPSVPKMDDRAALRRLYPAAGGMTDTARLRGHVLFTDSSGNAAQPMQGVNVIARRIDDGTPSRRYVAACVSGFAFRGNAGNPINGYLDSYGLRFDRFGADDSALEGFFDLGGLEFPDGQRTAQFQLSIEPVDFTWFPGVGPYSPWQVTPSGSFDPVVITLARGDDAAQDILMQQSVVADRPAGVGSSYATPSELPAGGSWRGSLTGYGSADWFRLSVRAGRTASVSVISLDESGMPTVDKAMPVIGFWRLTDDSGNPAPSSTSAAFNTLTRGLTRLDTQFFSTMSYRLGIADQRGDGRPDYSYTATVLYADSVIPSHASIRGDVVAISGVGFQPGHTVTLNGAPVTVLSASAQSILVRMPPATLDGAVSLEVKDPTTGGFSRMTDAFTYGASATDTLVLVRGDEPATPVGSPAANTIRIQVVDRTGLPVRGATVAWNTDNGALLSICNNQTACNTLSDDNGFTETQVTPTSIGLSTITVRLAPASYSPAQSKQATVLGVASSLDLGIVSPTRWIAEGATLDIPLTVRALSLGAARSHAVVNYFVTWGTVALSSASATTSATGYATVNAHLANHRTMTQVAACLAPENTICQTFTLFATPPSSWTLLPVSGSSQVISGTQTFQPLVVRVTDDTPSANPVMGVPVTFAASIARISSPPRYHDDGDTITGHPGMPALLGTSAATDLTDSSGFAGAVPAMAENYGPCDVFVTVTAGPARLQAHMASLRSADLGLGTRIGTARKAIQSRLAERMRQSKIFRRFTER